MEHIHVFPWCSIRGPPAGSISAKWPAARRVLNEVGQRYSAAKSYRIEAISEQTSSNELSRDWHKTISSAVVAPGGKYRYEGRSGSWAAILVCDGTTELSYHLDEHVYTQRAALGEDSIKGHVIPFEEMPLLEAKALMVKFMHPTDALKSASFLREETISVGGRSLDCYVVHYTDEDFRKPRKYKEETTIWIDKETKLVAKIFTHTQSEIMPTGIPILIETTVLYQKVQLDEQEPRRRFALCPRVTPSWWGSFPIYLELVGKFPDLPGIGGNKSADFLGKAAPELQLKSADGKVTELSSFRGKPVFIDFWATGVRTVCFPSKGIEGIACADGTEGARLDWD